MKKMKHAVCAVVLALAILAAVIPTAYAEGSYWMVKIDETALNMLATLDEDEELSVWVFFIDIDQDEADQKIAEITGFTEAEYDEYVFSMPSKTQEEKQAVSDFADWYHMTRIKVLSEMQSSHNREVIKVLGLNDSIVFLSELTPSAIVHIRSEKVFEIAQSDLVAAISYYGDEPLPAPEPTEDDPQLIENALKVYIAKKYRDSWVMPEIWQYEELYRHYDRNGRMDWVLIDARIGLPEMVTEMCVIGNRVAIMGPLERFRFGMAVYDVEKGTFLDLSVMKDYAAYDGLAEAIDLYGSGRLLGDLDGDDEISIIDATIIQRCEAGMRDYPETDIIDPYGMINSDISPMTVTYYSDFNRDGSRDILDATAIQRYLVKLPYLAG